MSEIFPAGSRVAASEIRARAKSAGSHFFDPATMRFFSSRVHGDGIVGSDGKIYFVTSEQYKAPGYVGPRRYTLRAQKPDGSVEMHGEFQQFATLREANKAKFDAAYGSDEVFSNPYTSRGWTDQEEAIWSAQTLARRRRRPYSVFRQPTGEFVELEGTSRYPENVKAAARHNWKLVAAVDREGRLKTLNRNPRTRIERASARSRVTGKFAGAVFSGNLPVLDPQPGGWYALKYWNPSAKKWNVPSALGSLAQVKKFMRDHGIHRALMLT
jgi:hypothetical protein